MNTAFVIVLLTTLGDFGVQANPNAPNAAQIAQYAPADADFMLHVDLQAVVPHNYKVLTSLPRHELVAQDPEAKAKVQEVLRELEAGMGMVKGMIGLDPINDIHSMTVWLKVPSAGDPQALAVVRGVFKPELIQRIADMGAKIVATDAGQAAEMPDGTMIALRKNELVVGASEWVKPRMTTGWKAERKGMVDADLRSVLDEKPFFVIASRPSQQAVKRVLREMPKGNVAADIVSGHEFATIALSSKGVAWMWRARGQEGYRRAVMASEGMLDVFRSMHIGTRGLAQLLMASVQSYRGEHPIIDAVLKHEKELMALVPQFTGDGKFRVDMKKEPKKNTVKVKATGNKLSDVLPIAGLLPGIGFAVFMGQGHHHDEMSAQEMKRESRAAEVRAVTPDTAASVAAPGLDVQTIYREAKRAHGM